MGTVVGEAALLQAMGVGAATGAATSAMTGGDPLKGALLGAATSGVGAGVAGAGAGAAAPTAATSTVPTAATSATAAMPQAATMANPGMIQPVLPQSAVMPPAAMPGATTTAATGIGPTNAAAANLPPPKMTALEQFYARNPVAVPAGLGALGSMVGDSYRGGLPEEEEYDGPLSRFRYSPGSYTPRRVASGGLMDTEPAKRMMAGGKLGSYSDGGQTLKGPGDGMSDSIPAKIGDKQPARLADGEFVIPADVVSGLGNGSTDAGARRLYAMMDKVRHARTGTKKQGREIDPDKYMPA